jgi:hypothetical protein
MADQQQVLVAAPVTVVMAGDQQQDIIRPGRKFKYNLAGDCGPPAPVDGGAVADQGLCLCYNGVAFNNPRQGFNLNTVFPYEKRTIWNAAVAPTVMSAEGVLVNLSQSAQARITEVYKGQALKVRIHKFKLFACDQCCKGGDCCAQCKACIACCSTRMVMEESFSVNSIYFGTADVPASMPNICTWLCTSCFWAFPFCENTFDIDISDVSVRGAPLKQWMV